MKKLLLAVIFCLVPAVAFGQCTGVFPPNTLCGNLSGSPAVPTAAIAPPGSIFGPISSTTNGLVLWGNTGGTSLIDGSGQTIAGTYTFSGTQSFSGTVNFNGTVNFVGTTFVTPSFTGVTTFAGAIRENVRSSSAATVTASATTDYFLCLDPTSNAITVNLPASPPTGLTYLIKDCTGQSLTHPITITPAAGNIDGGAAAIISSAYQSLAVTYTGAQWSIN